VWYTLDESDELAWYTATAPAKAGNPWVADMYRLASEGENLQDVPVGQMSITMLAEGDAVHTYILYGEAGSERIQLAPAGPPTKDAEYDVPETSSGLISAIEDLRGVELSDAEADALLEAVLDSHR
jgi:hypothetical protein